jgi:hypothetical protein
MESNATLVESLAVGNYRAYHDELTQFAGKHDITDECGVFFDFPEHSHTFMRSERQLRGPSYDNRDDTEPG